MQFLSPAFSKKHSFWLCVRSVLPSFHPSVPLKYYVTSYFGWGLEAIEMTECGWKFHNKKVDIKMIFIELYLTHEFIDNTTCTRSYID